MKYLCLFLLFSCLGLSIQRSTPQDDHYIAAVVEYRVDRDVENNLVNYANLIQEAAQQNADIVVFPELTLTDNSTYFEVPLYGALKEYPIPALHPDMYDRFLVAMSTAARRNNIYLVINGQESMNCTIPDTGEYCPEQKQYVFNTNVVFNRSGAVIDRYRKINLSGWHVAHTPALRPDLGVFTTDFGVTFGHFICFDLLFQVPGVQVVQKRNVKHVILPTRWYSTVPYLTAVEMPEAYAHTLDINILVASANNVTTASAGSGIYSGKAGSLISIMPGVPTTRVLVAKVPKVPGQVIDPVPGHIYDNPADHDELRLISDPSLPSHVTRLLVEGAQEFTMVDRNVSCTFKVTLRRREGSTPVQYRALIKDGTIDFAWRDMGVANCLVTACKTDNITTCGQRLGQNEGNTIEKLEIVMNTYRNTYNKTLHCDNIEYFPISFTTHKFPLNPKNFTFTTHDLSKCETDSPNRISVLQKKMLFQRNRTCINMRINVPQNELVSFGIWGRLYVRDVDHTKGRLVTSHTMMQ